MSLAATNIISAKYAFEFSDEELAAAFPGFTEDANVLRAKLATLRFWPNAQQMFARIPAIFTSRMNNGQAIDDIADIYGKRGDVQKIQSTATSILSQKKLDATQISSLTADEKAILVQYLSLYNLMKSNMGQYQQYVSNLLQQSILGNSQIMLFELN